MDFSSSNRNNTTPKWRKRQSSILKTYKIPFLFFTSLIIIAFFLFPKPIFPNSLLSQTCNKFNKEKLLFFAPHSGFSNQLQEFKNAILLAAILNRTLVLPPVLDHHSVALGSCPKFRVLEPNELRFKVWNHSLELLRDQRYVSMADIIDISFLESSSDVKFIDFRVFASMWCGVNLDLTCATGSSSHSSLLQKLKHCGSLLSGYDNSVNTCAYHSQEDCRTTVWTYQKDDDGVLDSFQADVELKKKKKISFVRMRKDVYKTFGPGSAAGHATVLSFGSLFTAPYKGSESHIDIHDAPKDKRIQLLIQKIEFLPFVPEILNAGKKFAVQTIGAPFLCVQLRLLDGQFKNHREATFRRIKQKLDMLKETVSLPIHIFVMTDLPKANWTGSYLGNMEKDSDAYMLFTLREDDDLVAQTTKQLVKAGRSLKFQSTSMIFDGREQQCKAQSLPDMLLYLEQTVCSCASLGFVGTSGSTISESIELMRINNSYMEKNVVVNPLKILIRLFFWELGQRPVQAIFRTPERGYIHGGAHTFLTGQNGGVKGNEHDLNVMLKMSCQSPSC